MFLSQIGHDPQHDFVAQLTFLSETPIQQITNKTSETKSMFGNELEAKDLIARVNNDKEPHKIQQEELLK